MTAVQPRAPPTKAPRMIDADQLLLRLGSLHADQQQRGLISHAHGVRKAVELIRRELAMPRENGPTNGRY